MSRMNVKKKMKLTHVFESYRDRLPPEVHEIIIAYKRGQEDIDEAQKERMKDLCHEIKKYGELKRKWEIGHVKCIVKKRMCFSCYTHHLRIVGCYEDEEKIPKKDFLVIILKWLWIESIVRDRFCKKMFFLYFL